ncbi:DUF5615 family PIN-like protein [Saliphagus infecundisoli]|uniref:DUF5615 family PIN-like protein n=1 Tax=Saliphagus infecundisoli TaxID=1849069 RepID=A0ABD5QKW7_9EURY|nr:DUF5615 family PIN-like protein [Saliphagus infecundisoli]
MAGIRLLTDEHVPGPFLTAIDALGYDVLRAKDEFPEGTPDRRLLEFGRATDRVVVTCDTRFAVIDGSLVTDHGGVIYTEQALLQRNPERAADAVDRIAATIPADEISGSEFYLSDWL